MNTPLHTILKTHEGLRYLPYRDRDGWAVGHGHQITPEEWMQRIASGCPAAISLEEAERLFLQDVASARRWFGRLFPDLDCSDVRKDALTAMIYQLGAGGVAQFRRMRRAIALGDWETAASEALDSKWAHQTPRRAHEAAEMLRSGHYPEWLAEQDHSPMSKANGKNRRNAASSIGLPYSQASKAST